MVEIIKPPTAKDWFFQWVCSNCGGTLKAGLNDVSESSDQRDSGTYVKCPICLTVKSVQAPKGYQYIRGRA